MLVTFVALLPKIVWRLIRSTYFPDDVEVIRQVVKMDPNHDFIHDPNMPTLRAAETYGIPVATEPSTTHKESRDHENPNHSYPMSPLQPVQSRASSIHHDMLTGQRTPSRGYTFSSDEPTNGRVKRRGTLRDRLLPGGIRRTLTKRKNRRLSTIRHSDAGHEDEQVEEFGQIADDQQNHQLDPGPEEEDEEAPEPISEVVLPPVQEQMNGPMSTNQ